MPERIYIKLSKELDSWYQIKDGNLTGPSSFANINTRLQSIIKNYLPGAIIYTRGDLIHRIDGPAIINPHGGIIEIWMCGGRKHRIGKPAITWKDGSTQYWEEGFLHRSDGPALMVNENYKIWVWHGIQCNSLYHWLDIAEIDEEEKALVKLQYA